MVFSGMGYDRKLMDRFKRRMFLKSEIKRLTLNSLKKNHSIAFSYRYSAYYSKVSLVRFSSVVQQRHRCIKSGRVWSVMKFSKYSRFNFRTESSKGLMPGFKRASW